MVRALAGDSTTTRERPFKVPMGRAREARLGLATGAFLAGAAFFLAGFFFLAALMSGGTPARPPPTAPSVRRGGRRRGRRARGPSRHAPPGWDRRPSGWRSRRSRAAG